MELGKFVSQTLTQILKGVDEVNQFAREKKGMKEDNFVYREYTTVNFDVVVTTQDVSKGGVEGGIHVASIFKVGAKDTDEKLNKAENRVQFELKVLAGSDVPPERKDEEYW